VVADVRDDAERPVLHRDEPLAELRLAQRRAPEVLGRAHVDPPASVRVGDDIPYTDAAIQGGEP
jgi:hypothetical protein